MQFKTIEVILYPVIRHRSNGLQLQWIIFQACLVSESDVYPHDDELVHHQVVAIWGTLFL